MNFKQKLMVAGIDLLILAELTFAVYKSSHGPVDDFTEAFLKLFVPAAIATIALGRVAVKKLSRQS